MKRYAWLIGASVALRGLLISNLSKLVVATALTICVVTGFAATKLVSFDTPEQEEFYEELLHEYRCLKCQNQSLAGSRADLAIDLRNEIRSQVIEGKNRSEIDEYLVARYGDFVLYKPAFKLSTLVLWLGPFVLLAVAGWYAVRVARGHRELSAAPTSSEPSEGVSQARSLLDD